MAREDFGACTDEEVRASVYAAASVRAARWAKSTKKVMESETDQDGPPVKFVVSDLEDWFVMGIARHLGIEPLFDDLFESDLGHRFRNLKREEVLS